MNKEYILKNIKKNNECYRYCFVKNSLTHKACLFCSSFKNSPYFQDYIKDKTDEEIAFDIYETIKRNEDD